MPAPAGPDFRDDRQRAQPSRFRDTEAGTIATPRPRSARSASATGVLASNAIRGVTPALAHAASN